MKKYLFTVEWINGSINDTITKSLRKANINYFYNHFGKLCADIHRDGNYSNLDCEKIRDDIYGVFEKAI